MLMMLGPGAADAHDAGAGAGKCEAASRRGGWQV